MGKRGPAKKPSALEKLQGNPGKRSPNKREPNPERGIPRVPAHLDGVGKYFFRKYAEILDGIKVITKADAAALELAADAYSEYRACRKVIALSGSSYECLTKAGEVLVKARPEVAQAQSAWTRCAKMLQQFGLTPSSRTGVQTVNNGEEDGFEAFLGKKPEIRRVK